MGENELIRCGSRREISFLIDQEADGWTVEDYLRQRQNFTLHQIRRFKFRRGGMRRNGRQIRSTEKLQVGDRLQIPLSGGDSSASCWEEPDPQIQDDFPLRLIYEDADLLVVNKASGLVCHPSPGHYRDTLCNQVAAYLGGEDFHIVGRLDKDTSGCVLFARHVEAAGILARQRETGHFFKTYLADVCGQIPLDREGRGRIEGRVGRAEGAGIRMQIDEEKGKMACTLYRSLDEGRISGQVRSLLEVRIIQGRTHQIRVHMASIGHPVCYDPIYGEGGDGEPLHLHAEILNFIHPVLGIPIQLEAERPAWLGVAGRHSYEA